MIYSNCMSHVTNSALQIRESRWTDLHTARNACKSYDILQMQESTFRKQVLLEHSGAAGDLAILPQRRQRPLAVELCQDVLHQGTVDTF